MTYRENRERRAERLRDAATRNDAKSADAHKTYDQISSTIPFGQPILVGHHSEKRHRRDLTRIDRAMETSVEAGRKADEQRARADEIERQADKSIYSDDPDALERLRNKLAHLEARREAMKAANADYRREHRDELKALTPYERHQAMPHPSYALTNIGGVISNTRKRIEVLSTPERWRPLVTRRDGECRACGVAIVTGTRVRYYPRSKVIECMECEPQRAAA